MSYAGNRANNKRANALEQDNMQLTTILTSLALGGAFSLATTILFNPKASAPEALCGALTGITMAGMALLLWSGV